MRTTNGAVVWTTSESALNYALMNFVGQGGDWSGALELNAAGDSLVQQKLVVQ